MAHRIRRFAPAQAAKVLGILYAIMGLIFVPIFLLVALFDPDGTGAFGVGFAIVLPVFYGVVGAIAVAIGCMLYNLVAGWVGGIEIELGETEPEA